MKQTRMQYVCNKEIAHAFVGSRHCSIWGAEATILNSYCAVAWTQVKAIIGKQREGQCHEQLLSPLFYLL